jgi:hypothetical protein
MNETATVTGKVCVAGRYRQNGIKEAIRAATSRERRPEQNRLEPGPRWRRLDAAESAGGRPMLLSPSAIRDRRGLFLLSQLVRRGRSWFAGFDMFIRLFGIGFQPVRIFKF